MKTVELAELEAVHMIMEDPAFDYESVIVERDGQPVAALVPYAEFEAFQAWQQSEARSQRRQVALTAFEQDHAAFERMKPELLRNYAGAVVAIYQGQIVEVGTDVAETLDRVYDRFGYVPCYVQRVEASAPVYKFTHRQVVH